MRAAAILIALIGGLVSACAHKPAPPEEAPVEAKWIESVASDHNHEVLFCYQDALKTHPQIHGDFVVTVDTDAEGKVTAARVLQQLDPKFDACVLKDAKTWQFPWIKKATSDLESPFHLKLGSGDQPVSDFGRPRVEKDDVRITVRNHLDDVNHCYETRLRRAPKLQGKLVLEWDIGEKGEVHAAHVKQALDPELDHCVLELLNVWKFPPPPTNMSKRVTYPFVFSQNI